MNRHLLATISLIFLIGYRTVAQTDAQCSRALDEAEQAFEQGRLLFILDKSLNKRFYDCLEGGNYTIAEEIRAKKLLVKAYLFSDDEQKAEEALVDLLNADKEHPLTSEDPAELYFLYSKFKTEPIIRVSAKLGGNKTFITQLQEFNPSPYAKNYNPGISSGLHLWAELLAERHLYKGIEVAGGPQLRFTRFDLEGISVLNGLTYNVSNVSTALRLPIMLRYNIGYDAKDDEGKRKTMTPYLFAGASYDLIFDAKYIETNRSGGTAVTLPIENSSLSDQNQVSRQNASIFGGVGIKLRVGRERVNYLSFELRYDNSLFNYINPDNRWVNQNTNFDISHLEDDLTINTLSFSAGYIHSLYIPRKRKQYRQ